MLDEDREQIEGYRAYLQQMCPDDLDLTVDTRTPAQVKRDDVRIDLTYDTYR